MHSVEWAIDHDIAISSRRIRLLASMDIQNGDLEKS